ncbi:MAG: ATP-binding protein [Rhodospirillaceae bacterium]
MQRVVRIFTSFTFRLAVIYTLIFGISVGGLFYFVYWATSGFAEQQMEAAIEAEVLTFQESLARAGVQGLIMAVNRRADPNTNRDGVYLLTDRLGNPLAGNMRVWPQRSEGGDDVWINFTTSDNRGATPATADVRALQLMDPDSGVRLLVGRDVRAARVFRERLQSSVNVGLALTVALGLIGGYIFSRTIMGRIESVTRTCRSIMSGDLSKRVPVGHRNDELSQLSVSINSMLDQIERLMRGMQQVSESVAHDLRTPLTRLRSRLENSLRHVDDPAQRTAIEGALEDADSLLATFAALLRVARAEAGTQKNFVDIDLHTLAEEVADLYGPLAEEKGLSFITRFEQDMFVKGDPNLLAQALANLIDNAIKYTEEGAVTAVLTRQKGLPVFIVCDTGPGVPDEYKDKVLERLFRLEQSRTSPGSGLGLALVAAVAKSHGLELKLEDNAPGLKVSLRFPPGLVATDPKLAGAGSVKSLPAPGKTPSSPEAAAA